MTNITDEFIEGIYKLNKNEFSTSLINQAKRCLLDYLGVTLAGAKSLKNKSNEFMDLQNDYSEQNHLIGFNKKSSLKNAMFLNGLSAHYLDFDDGVNSGIIHLGSPIFSALLPLAEKEKISGEQFLKSVILAYETSLRIANAIQPSHKEKGYHATGTCGTIGVAIGIGVALKFSKNQLKDSLSAATVSSSGTLKVLEDASDLKPYNVAKAALMGFISATMSRIGFSGPEDALSGERGFLKMMSDDIDVTHLDLEQGDSFAIEKVYFKPYAACRYCHPSIEASLEIKKHNIINIDNIKMINIETYYWAVNKHDHTNIQGTTSAKMSIPYSVAVALIKGKADLEEFEKEQINDQNILSLTKKVKVKSNKKLTMDFPQKSPAIVEIITKDGSVYTEKVDFPKGEPENPLSENELKEKFISLATYADKTEAEAKEIIKCVWNIENDLNKLFDLL